VVCRGLSWLPWIAIVVEVIGISLVATELYIPKLSEALKRVFEQAKPKIIRRPVFWISGYCVTWVLAVVILSINNHAMILITNIIFIAFTVVVLLLLMISRCLIKLGVSMGRGNSVGGVGLVLAVIGLYIEIYQLPPF
jgi:hypothetical protein